MSYIVLSPRDVTAKKSISKLPQNLWVDNRNQINNFLCDYQYWVQVPGHCTWILPWFIPDYFPSPYRQVRSALNTDRHTFIPSENPRGVTTSGSIIMSIWHCPGSSPFQTDCLATSLCSCPHLSLDGLSPRKHQDLSPSFISMPVNDILAEETLRGKGYLRLRWWAAAQPISAEKLRKQEPGAGGWSRYQSEGERSECMHHHLSCLLLELLSSLGPRSTWGPVHTVNFPRFFLLVRPMPHPDR